MTYLWDTNTCIYHLNGNSRIKQKIQSVDSELLSCFFLHSSLLFIIYSSIAESHKKRTFNLLLKAFGAFL